MNRKGMSVIESAIVLTVMAIIVVLVAVKWDEALLPFRDLSARGSLSSLRSQISLFYDRQARWPDVTDLEAHGNPVTGASEVHPVESKPGSPDTQYGWFYMTSNGHIWAANDVDW